MVDNKDRDEEVVTHQKCTLEWRNVVKLCNMVLLNLAECMNGSLMLLILDISTHIAV